MKGRRLLSSTILGSFLVYAASPLTMSPGRCDWVTTSKASSRDLGTFSIYLVEWLASLLFAGAGEREGDPAGRVLIRKKQTTLRAQHRLGFPHLEGHSVPGEGPAAAALRSPHSAERAVEGNPVGARGFRALFSGLSPPILPF